MPAVTGDVLEILGRPEYPAAVQWSEDNLLAVAAGPSVIIVNPGQLRGPRASTVLPEASTSLLEADEYPEEPQESCTYSATYLRTRGMCQQRNTQIASSRLGIKAVSWSPLGCDLSGNALLTSVTENHQVRVHSPPMGCQTCWDTVIELSAKLKKSLQADKWQSIDSMESSLSLTVQDFLRLRGGAGGQKKSELSSRKKPKAAAAEGSRLENAEKPSKVDANAAEPIHYTADSAKQFSELPHRFSVNDRIEVMNDEEGLQGSWFQGTITQLHHGFALIAYDELMVSENSDEKLQEWFPLPGTPEGHRALPEATHDSHFGSGFKIRPPPPPELARRGGGRNLHDDVDALDDGGWWEGRVTQVLKQRCKVQPFVSNALLTVRREDVRTGVVWDAQGWSARQAAGIHQGGAAPAQASSKKRKAQALVDSDDSESGSDSNQASPEPASVSKGKAEAYQVPANFDASCIAEVDDSSADKLAQTLAIAIMERADTLRQPADSVALPQYKAGHMLADTNAAIMERASAEVIHVHGERMQAAKVTERKVKHRARQLCCEHIFKNAGTRSGHRPSIILPFKVPEGFSAGDLPPVELTSNRGGRSSLFRASAARFFALRKQVPEDQQPRYSNYKEPLAPVDASLVNQVVTEFCAAYSAAMSEHDIARGEYVKGFRDKLRLCWDRVLDPTAKHVQLDKRVRGAQANVNLGHLLKAAQAQNDSTSSSDRDSDHQGPSSGPTPVAYQVPANFDKAVLGDVDLSTSDAAEFGLANAFWLRWMDLRKEIPEEQCESYSKGQHLRGADARNADRVRAEIVAAFGKDMKKLGVTDQRIVTVGKQLIRNRIIQTRALLAHSSGKPRREWTGQQEQDLRKLAKRRRAATGFSDDDNQLWEDVPTYSVPANFDKEALGAVDLSTKDKACRSLPLAFKRRWLDLRSKMAESEVPVYATNEHFQGPDARNAEQARAEMMSAYGQGMQGLGFTESWLMAAGKQLIWQRFLQSKIRKQGGSLQAPPADGDASQEVAPSVSAKRCKQSKTTSKATKAAAAAAVADETYTVPEDFEAAVLGQPDFSSKADAERTMADLFVKRWWDLREQAPEGAEHETYKKGQHLRGVDAANAEQVRAEMMSAFASEMDRLGMTEKILVRDGKRLIRQDLKASQPAASDLLQAPESVEESEEQPSANIDPNSRRPRRKAAVSARKSLRAARHSPDSVPSDDEYKGGSDEEAKEGKSDDDDMGSVVDDEEEDEEDMEQAENEEEAGMPDIPVRKGSIRRPKRRERGPKSQQAARGSAHLPDKLVPLTLSPQVYLQRVNALAAMQAAWSPICAFADPDNTGRQQGFAMLAVGCKAGVVWLWRFRVPSQYYPSGRLSPEEFTLVGGFQAQRSYVTALSWASMPDSSNPTATFTQPHRQPLLQGNDHLMLFSGSSDGCVRLHVQSVEFMGAMQMQSPGQLLKVGLMQSSKTLHEVDLLSVTCLAVKTLDIFQAGQPRLIVAAGKAGGALLTCRVSQGKAGAADSSSAGSVLPQLHCSQVCLHRGAHSSRNVTGVAWASADLPFAETLQKKLAQQQPGQAEQPRRQQQQQALLISSGADGKIRRWAVSLDESSLGLVEAECPAAWSRPSLEKDAAFDPLGVALSGNGLFLAVAADNGTTAVAAVQQDMIYKRLYNGNVVLHRLCGPPPHPWDPTAAATAVAGQLSQGSLHPNRLWDLAHVLKQHAQMAVEAAAANTARASGSASPPASAPASAAASPLAAGKQATSATDQGGAGEEALDPQQTAATSNAPSESWPNEATAADMLTLDRAVTESELIQAVLDALEQPFYQQQTRGGQLTPQLAWGASQGLRCAATLRRLLHPGRLLPKQAEVCEEPPWQQLATATHVAQQLPAQDAAASKPHIEAWEQALQAVELHLLQLHIEATLQKPWLVSSSEQQRLSEVLMADWVTMHQKQPWLHPHLLKLAQQAHAKLGIQDTASAGSAPAREMSEWFGTALRLEGAPLDSAKCIPPSKAVPMGLQRCAASLLVCETIEVWQCQLCDRRYLHAPVGISAIPSCLYCGTSLGVTCASQALRPPALL